MSKFQQKAEAQTKQIIGQMLGDELLVEEGKEQQREATEPGSTGDRHDNDRHDQGIVRDERGQEQPREKRKRRLSPSARRQLPDVDTDLSRQAKRRPVSRLSLRSRIRCRY